MSLTERLDGFFRRHPGWFFFVLVLEMAFQFSLELVRHDDSSCESVELYLAVLLA